MARRPSRKPWIRWVAILAVASMVVVAVAAALTGTTPEEGDEFEDARAVPVALRRAVANVDGATG